MKHGLALCAGIGGLDLGLRDAFGLVPACYVERDPFASAVLVARMADGSIDRAPIWDDLRTFDACAWRGRVDWLSAGYPCQPFSVAGARRGSDDPRHLWPDVRRIIGESGVSVVFLENVPGHLSLGFAEVLADIAALGFDAEWGVLGADAVGASHLRERLWVVAYRDGERCGLERLARIPDDIDAPFGHDTDGRDRSRSALADGRFPPCPDDHEGWLAWMGAQPVIRRGADGLPGRVGRLRTLGNAVVPQCASEAFRQLVQRLTAPAAR